MIERTPWQDRLDELTLAGEAKTWRIVSRCVRGVMVLAMAALVVQVFTLSVMAADTIETAKKAQEELRLTGALIVGVMILACVILLLSRKNDQVQSALIASMTTHAAELKALNERAVVLAEQSKNIQIAHIEQLRDNRMMMSEIRTVMTATAEAAHANATAVAKCWQLQAGHGKTAGG